MIDVSKLEVGGIYSYKELCELTGAKYEKGAGKKYQLEKYGETGFRRFFDFEKIERAKYKIYEIYDEPLPVEDERSKGNKQIYTHYIELVLMNYLAHKGTHVETFTIRDLWRLLGMINNKYDRVSYEELLSLDKQITTFEINNFYLRSDRKLRQILLSALKNLRNRRLIDWQLQTVICKEKNNYEEWFVANDEELKIILETEYEILHKMGYTKMFQVIASFKTNEFYKKVEERLYEKRRWKNYYKRYKIIFNIKNLKESIPDVEVGLQKALLNAKIVSFLNNEAENLYYSKLNEDGENGFQYPISYIIAQKMLSNELIYTNDYAKSMIDDAINFNEIDEELEELFKI